MGNALPFSDHHVLLGREKDLVFLLQRVEKSGITFVTGRPRMGKTLLLQKTSTRLCETARMVGYHECLETEGSLFLRATANLYANWLAAAGMIEQGRSLWERHKGDFVTKAGKAVGRVFDSLAGLLSPAQKIGSLVRESFDALAEGNRDVKTGGLSLPPLDYNQAIELLRILQLLAKPPCPMVLVLDALEKTTVLKSEFHLLQSFLAHLNDWPLLHVLAGLRCPELDEVGRDQAYEYACDLHKGSTAVVAIHELPSIDLSDSNERIRLEKWAQTRFPKQLDWAVDELLLWIDGFPGVLGYWEDAAGQMAIHTRSDLSRLANDAQQYRHREFDKLLPSLSAKHRGVAMRLAIMPRMDQDSWQLFKSIVLSGNDESTWRDLLRAHVLEDSERKGIPSYGHDTRHWAAYRWFADHPGFRLDLASEAASLIMDIGATWRSFAERDYPYAEALRALRRKTTDLPVGDIALTILDAGESLFQDSNLVNWKRFFNTWPQVLAADRRQVSVLSASICRWADIDGNVSTVIANLSAAIEMAEAPTEHKVTARLHRGADYIKRAQEGDLQRAIDDYSAVIDMSDAPALSKVFARFDRGVAFSRQEQEGDWQRAVDDYSTVIDMPDAPSVQKARAYFNRGWQYEHRGQEGDWQRAVDNYSAVIDMPEALAEPKARARNRRGVLYGERGQEGDWELEVDDYSAVIDMPDAPADEKAMARYNRAVRYAQRGQGGDWQQAIDDYSAVMYMPDAPADPKALASFNRGMFYAQRGHEGDLQRALDDFSAVIGMPEAPAECKAKAYCSRGVVFGQRGQEGDWQRALDDESTVINMPNGPAESKAIAMLNRGNRYAQPGQEGDLQRAFEDLSAVIDMADAPAKPKALARLNRSLLYGRRRQEGDFKRSLDDFSTVINMPDAPAEVITAWHNAKSIFVAGLQTMR